MSKKWANLAKRWFSGHKCHCWLKIVKHWDKRDNGVLCTGKEIKSGLKLARMENIYMPAPFKKKPEYWDTNIVLLQISAK